MATVGELVNAAGRDLPPLCDNEDVDYDDWRDCRLRRGELEKLYVGLLSRLQALGIWDAEVHEGYMGEDDADDVVLFYSPAPLHTWDDWRKCGYTPGQMVRVIVLPCPEKEE